MTSHTDPRSLRAAQLRCAASDAEHIAGRLRAAELYDLQLRAEQLAADIAAAARDDEPTRDFPLPLTPPKEP